MDFNHFLKMACHATTLYRATKHKYEAGLCHTKLAEAEALAKEEVLTQEEAYLFAMSPAFAYPRLPAWQATADSLRPLLSMFTSGHP
jgi:hypothetical protein